MLDWYGLRQLFPITNHSVYLDHGSLCPLPTPVLEAVTAFHNERARKGRDYMRWWDTADRVRESLGQLIGACSEEIAFTDSTTQAANIIAQGLRFVPGDNVVVSEMEFPSNLYPWLHLRAKGVEVRILKRGDGSLTTEKLDAFIDENTRLVAVSHVQAANGFRCNLNAISELCRSSGALLFVDATQSLGAFQLNVKEITVDFLAVSAYKWLMAPDGIGFLYVSKERLQEIDFTFLGWSGRVDRNNFFEHPMDFPAETRRFELGNLNFSAIHGLDASLKLLSAISVDSITNRVLLLADYFKSKIKQVKQVKLLSDFAPENTSPILAINLPERKKAFDMLSNKGFVTALRHDSIRVSPYFYNTEDELGAFVNCLEEM